MKISLFTKPYIIKACSFLAIISLIAGTPKLADASFLSDVSDLTAFVFGGTKAQADETTPTDDNLQNVDIIGTESFAPPTTEPIIGSGGSFIYNDDLSETDSNSLNLEKSPLSDQISVYIVKEGDTLSQLAETFGISTNTIIWENNISGQKISIGQKLNIIPVTGVKHIVKSGDTISKIADKYDADANDVSVFNGISTGDKLTPGDIIFVPNGIIKPIISNTKPSTGGSTSVTSNTKVQDGYYIRPVPGRVTSPYGSRHGSFHPGVDLAGVKGVTPVVVAADGVVTEVVSGCKEGSKRCGGGYGNHIEVVHPNGATTRYAHLSKTSVVTGQTISQGQDIGILGNSGNSTGPHLHFEIINANGSKMKPPVS
jgi:murein DD-endopeptidase MepM/ murein hydrolase activator NlpD